jgi:hypothetical protein
MRTERGSLSPPRSSVRKVTIARPHRLQGGHRVGVVLLLGGQIGPLEVQELGAEQPDRFAPTLDRVRHLLDQLDVGRQVHPLPSRVTAG